MKLLGKIIFIFLLFQSVWADEFASQKEQCSKDPSRKWSSQLNRCMTTDEFNESLANYKNCTTKDTKAQRDKCMRDLVLAVSGDVSLDSFEWDDAAMTLISAFLTISNTQFMEKSTEVTTCTSLKIATGCGIAAMLKTAYITMKAGKETESNEKDFLEKAKDKGDYETQVIAYQSQVDQLNSLSKYYYLKAKLNKFVAACYTAAAASAVIDMTYGSNHCLLTESEAKAEQAKADKAAGPDKTGKIDKTGIFGEKMGAAEGFWDKGAQFMKTPVGVATLSVINVGWNMHKATKLSEQGEKAKLLALRADVAKNQFITGMTKYCPKGHEDKSDPICYCYDGGKKMENRTNSKMCQDLWGSRDRNLYAASSDKTRKDPNAVRRGCVSQAGQFDPECKCRKFKDQSGNNACRKASFSTIKLGSLGNALNIKELESSLNKIQSGLDNPDGFKFSNAVNSAVQDKVRKQTLAKLKVKDKSGVERPMTEKDIKNIEAKLTGDLKASGAVKLAAKTNKTLSDISKKSMAAISSKTPKGRSLQMSGGKGQVNARKKKNKSVAFNLDMGSQGSVQNFGKSYMNKTYNMKDADVVKNKDVSIFKVLSNRYTKSAYKRLFEGAE